MATAAKLGEAQDAPNSRPAGLADRALAGGRAALAALAILLALLLNELFFHEYPLRTPEVGLAFLALAAMALVYGTVFAVSNRWARAGLETLLVAGALDALKPGKLVPIAAALAVFVFVLWKRRSILPFITVMAAVAMLSSALGIGQQLAAAFNETAAPANTAAPNSKLPAVVHIVLDEHVGLDGLPAGNPRSAAMRTALEQFYLGHGFRVFPRAHSTFAFTINAIPEMLNFGEAQQPMISVEKKRTVRKIAYFDLLQKRGYKLRIYQSDWLNYCRSVAVAMCLTYQTQNIRGLAPLPISPSTKAQLILGRMATKSLCKLVASIYHGLQNLGLPLPYRDISEIRVTPVNAALTFDRFNRDLSKARPGEVYFAHILLPHSPFALTRDCHFIDGVWMRRQRRVPITARQDAGYDQMLCTLRKVEAAYQAVSSSPAGKNFVMIVHGDHGSRITNTEPDVADPRTMTDAEKIATFSALFAVRAPGLEAGLDHAPLPLSRLIEDLARSNFTEVKEAPQTAQRNWAVLDDHLHVPRAKVVLPRGW